MKKTLVFLLSTLLLLGCKGKPSVLDYVNPMTGTDANGHTFPGACVPFGMISASPDTHDHDWNHCSGYHWADSTIMGFSQTHLSGTGAGDMGDIRIMPISGEPRFSPGNLHIPGSGYRVNFSHVQETASPGYYSVMLDGVLSEVTATARCAIYRFTFPEGRKAGLLFDMQHGINDRPVAVHLEMCGPSSVRGYRRSKGFIGDHVYFFMADIKSDIIAAEQSGDGKKIYLEFPPGSTVLLKLGLSTVGFSGAAGNLRREIPGWSFDSVRKRAQSDWRKALSCIEIKDCLSQEDARVFYTALYHCMIAPSLMSDCNGDWCDRNQEIHTSDTPVYTTFSLWDTYRALHPLYNLVLRDKNADFINSMLLHYRSTGRLPIHVFGGYEVFGMIGLHSLPVLADAIMQDVPGFDYREAYTAMKQQALDCSVRYTENMKYILDGGYIPADLQKNSVSKLMEYSYDWWCVARVAEKLGEAGDAEFFGNLALSYRNVYDSASGFMRPRNSDGSWKAGFNPDEIVPNRESDYTEGNAWQYSFYAPHDMPELIAMHGGPEPFCTMLDTMFTRPLPASFNRVKDVSGLIGQYAHGNEPSHHVAYLYAMAGKPWKTQQLVSKIKKSLYSSRPDGLCGNEDCGQMSAWFVFSALGFYPVAPASGEFVLGTPTFREIAVHLPEGKTLTVRAPEVSDKNIYVKSVFFNGKPCEGSRIKGEDLLKGGDLYFEMAAEPSINIISE